jgi:hypothetical protein
MQMVAICPVSQCANRVRAPAVSIRNYELTEECLAEYADFLEDGWKTINRGNAERLFPQSEGQVMERSNREISQRLSANMVL